MPETKNVCIVGAGPAGLLAAILLLRRNSKSTNIKYKVTLIDPGTDYGKLTEDGLRTHRSWMIGLSCHGLKAIRTVPGLYENYIHGLGLDISGFVMGLSNKLQIRAKLEDIGMPKEAAFTVDRNYICAALSRYLNEHFEGSDNFQAMYDTRALYVDGDNHCLVVRPNNKNGGRDDQIKYDLVLGCDGIRSIVRNAFLTCHRDFEFNTRGTHGEGKSVHVPLPKNVEPGTFMFLANCLPGYSAFVLPETDSILNVAMGRSCDNPNPPELESSDPKVVQAYFEQHFTAFELDCESAAEQWVNQSVNTVGQVHCNFYHSQRLKALLMGDAAHATSPQIGQGMNTALADAAALDALLDEHGDDCWENVILPAFSAARVKEGNALTDLSFHTFSLSGKLQLELMVRQTARRFFNRRLPWLVAPDPMMEVGKGMALSEAYDQMKAFGVIERCRAANDGIMRDYFEKQCGMVKNHGKSGTLRRFMTYVVLPVVVVVAARAWMDDSPSSATI